MQIRYTFSLFLVLSILAAPQFAGAYSFADKAEFSDTVTKEENLDRNRSLEDDYADRTRNLEQEYAEQHIANAPEETYLDDQPEEWQEDQHAAGFRRYPPRQYVPLPPGFDVGSPDVFMRPPVPQPFPGPFPPQGPGPLYGNAVSSDAHVTHIPAPLLPDPVPAHADVLFGKGKGKGIIPPILPSSGLGMQMIAVGVMGGVLAWKRRKKTM